VTGMVATTLSGVYSTISIPKVFMTVF